MPYTAEISRANPACLLLLVNQSGSMRDVMNPEVLHQTGKLLTADGPEAIHEPTTHSKARGVADATNRLLQNLVIKCAKPEGVRDLYEVGVIGYGGDLSASRVGPAFVGMLEGKELVSISEMANNPARIKERSKKVDDGDGRLIEQKAKFPIWLDPIANGRSPMSRAMDMAQKLLAAWVALHPDGFPPIVINITDGVWPDADPTSAANSIKALATDDGNALLFNVCVSSDQNHWVEFPDDEAKLGDLYAKYLFRLSSHLPACLRSSAHSDGSSISGLARGFAMGANMPALTNFMNISIATRASSIN